jgi:hypothetical protein
MNDTTRSEADEAVRRETEEIKRQQAEQPAPSIGAEAEVTIETKVEGYGEGPYPEERVSLEDVKAALGAGATEDAIMDEMERRAEKVLDGKDISTEGDILLKANMALGRLVTENMMILVEMINQIRAGLENGRAINARRMLTMQDQHQQVMVRLEVLEKAIQASECRALGWRPIVGGGGGLNTGPAGATGGGSGAPLYPTPPEK